MLKIRTSLYHDTVDTVKSLFLAVLKMEASPYLGTVGNCGKALPRHCWKLCQGPTLALLETVARPYLGTVENCGKALPWHCWKLWQGPTLALLETLPWHCWKLWQGPTLALLETAARPYLGTVGNCV